ncbi:MAG: hypothetical protein K6F86_03875 [Lachnospiraceae bacterium]|nr:hypothetical protein [Lachnospiraceae bacterium]
MVPKAIVVQDEWKSSWKKQSDGTYVDNGNFYEASLKEGKDYSLENVKKYDKDGKEVQDDKDTYYMTADVTAKNTDLFKGKVPVKVDVYGKEVKDVKITRISDNKATSTNAVTDSSGKHYVMFRGTQENEGEDMSVCPRVVEIVIVYKDGSQSDPIRPKDLNGDLADDPRFFIDAADIGNITNKAEIVFRFKDGTMGPTDKIYTARYSIVGQDKFPK